MPISSVQHRINIGHYHNRTYSYNDQMKVQATLNNMAASPGNREQHAKAQLVIQALLLVSNIIFDQNTMVNSSYNILYEIKEPMRRRQLSNALMLSGSVPFSRSLPRNTIPFISPLPSSTAAGRVKRMSLAISTAQSENAYREYIENNCHIRTKTNQGTVLGDSMLVAGEYVRNPVRGVYETLKDLIAGDGELSYTESMVFEIINIGQDLLLGFFTLGAYPIIKYSAAKVLTVSGQVANDYSTCIKNEFTAEEIANLLFNTEVGITDRMAFRHARYHPKPRELVNVHPFVPDGLFVSEQTPIGISTVKHVTVNHEGITHSVYLTESGSTVAKPIHGASIGPSPKKVYFDAKNNKIHFDAAMDLEHGLDYQIREGKKYIMLHEENYEIVFTGQENTPALKFKKYNGAELLVPVYKERISHTWHMSTHNNKRVFRAKQKKIIASWKKNFNREYDYVPVDNLNQNCYGLGKIIEVRAKNAVGNEKSVISKLIELNGELLPVREVTMPGRGVKYKIFNSAVRRSRGRAVEFDGCRWLFESPTSIHVGKTLRRGITKKTPANEISANELSAPDEKGLRWDLKGNAYLKIKNRHFIIKKYHGSDNKYFFWNNGIKINLRFRKNKFNIETYKERLKDLRLKGMSGHGGMRKRKKAVDVLKEIDGYDLHQAKTLLAAYRFPLNGFLNDYNFALDIERNGAIPSWAKRFKIDDEVSTPVYLGETIVDVKADDERTIAHSLYLGEIIGKGDFGTVYKDSRNEGFYIKKMNPRLQRTSDINIKAMADGEAEAFRHFYGPESAKVYVSEKGIIYNRMYKIPGLPLEDVPENSLPLDAVERFVDMIEKMVNVNIIHADLNTNNIMWDAESKMFFPIDISNVKQNFFKGSPDFKAAQNRHSEEYWGYAIEAIKEKMVSSPELGLEPRPEPKSVAGPSGVITSAQST